MPTTLRRYNIYNDRYIHWDIGIAPMVLLAITLFIGMKFLLRNYFK